MDKICTIMFLRFTFHGKLLSASASWYNFYCLMSLFDFRYMISVSPLVSSIWRAMPASQDLRRLNGITGNLNVSVLQLSFCSQKYPAMSPVIILIFEYFLIFFYFAVPYQLSMQCLLLLCHSTLCFGLIYILIVNLLALLLSGIQCCLRSLLV